MNSAKWIPLIACACFMPVAGDVGAAVSLSLRDSHELGFVDPGLPAGDPFVAPYVNQLIGMGLNTSTVIDGNTFFRSGNVFSPLDTAILGPRTTYGEITDTTVSIALGSGYEYLMAKYDGPNYGTEVWYVGDLSGTITIPSRADQFGISTVSLFTPTSASRIPDGGTTALMLSTALAGLGVLKRRIGVVRP